MGSIKGDQGEVFLFKYKNCKRVPKREEKKKKAKRKKTRKGGERVEKNVRTYQ